MNIMTENKPLVKLKTQKGKLIHIKKNGVDYTKFDECLYKTSDVVFICSNFINAYLLYLLKSNKDIPVTNYDFIRMAFKAISKASVGPRPKGEQGKLYEKLCDFFKTEFVKTLTDDKNITDATIENYKLDSTNLSYIFNEHSTEIETAIVNNIKLNFFKYVHQYVNESFIQRDFKFLTRDEYMDLSEEDKNKYITDKRNENERIKDIKKELFYVKNDLCDKNVIFTSDPKYHDWIKENKSVIFPKLEKESLSYEQDIKVNCFKYLKHMLKMNQILEGKVKKLFTAVPLRTDIKDKFVHIDSSALKDIFGEINSGLTNKQLWEKYFNINPSKFGYKNYSFNFRISTNGLEVALNFIHNDCVEAKMKKVKAMTDASKNSKKKMALLTEDGKKEYKQKNAENKKQKEISAVEKKEALKKKKKEEYKNLPKEEQEKIKLEMKLRMHKYEHIEDAVKTQAGREILLEEFQNGNIKVIDPGMRAPLTILGKPVKDKKMSIRTPLQKAVRKTQTGKIRKDMILYSYSSGARINGTKRLRYNRLIENKKKKVVIGEKTTIKDLENELSKYNSKTTNYENFMNYVKLKIKMRRLVSPYENILATQKLKKIDAKTQKKKCSILKKEIKNVEAGIEYNNYLKKLKWFAYLNKERHESKLLDDIEKVYGSDSIFVIGDWSASGKIKRISMPNMGMKRLLSKRFKTYLLDEYLTSKLSHKTGEETNNLFVNKIYEKEGKQYKINNKIHSVLTFKMGSKNQGCINRDYNATLNMYEIVTSLVTTGKRPERFIRKSNKKKDKSNNKKVTKPKQSKTKVIHQNDTSTGKGITRTEN